jgi:hypothetical protein
MEAIKKRFFENETIELDDAHFINCKFKDCNFVYRGGESPIFDGCEFDSITEIKFVESAFETHRCMNEIYQKMGKEGKSYVENLFESIRKNVPPTMIQ